MKKLLLLVVVLLGACSQYIAPKQKIAQRLVKNYLQTNPGNGTNYKAQGFDDVATLYQVIRPIGGRRDTVTIYTKDTGNKSAPDSTVVGYKIAGQYSYRDESGSRHTANSFFWIDLGMTRVIRVTEDKR